MENQKESSAVSDDDPLRPTMRSSVTRNDDNKLFSVVVDFLECNWFQGTENVFVGQVDEVSNQEVSDDDTLCPTMVLAPARKDDCTSLSVVVDPNPLCMQLISAGRKGFGGL